MNTEDRLKEMMSAVRVQENATQAEWKRFVERAHRPLYARRAAVVIGACALVGIGAFAARSFPADEPNVRPLPPVSTPTPTPEPTPSPEATVQVPPSENELWFVQDEILSWGTTVVGGEVSTEVAGDDPVAQKAAYWLQMLLSGAQGPFQEAGDTSAIPEGTELLHVARDDVVLEVDLSSEFETGGGSLSMQLRVAQIVYTATQFEGIERIRILIEGEHVDAIGGEGMPAEAGRRDFQNVAPAIVLESPKPGDEVSTPVTISGFANTFEANVVIRIRDANGEVLVETFTTATCGSGCWGDFSEDVAYEVAAQQEGRVEVLTYSAEDGSERDIISVPVVLTP